MKKFEIILSFALLLFANFYLEVKELPVNPRIIDLSYPFNEKTLYWPTEDSFSKQVEFHGKTEKGYFYAANRLHMAEHGGTHIDAPLHFNEFGKSVEAIALEDLMGLAVLIDVSSQALKNRDYLISIQDIQDFEKKHGLIPEHSMVLFKRGG